MGVEIFKLSFLLRSNFLCKEEDSTGGEGGSVVVVVVAVAERDGDGT